MNTLKEISNIFKAHFLMHSISLAYTFVGYTNTDLGGCLDT